MSGSRFRDKHGALPKDPTLLSWTDISIFCTPTLSGSNRNIRLVIFFIMGTKVGLFSIIWSNKEKKLIWNTLNLNFEFIYFEF